MSGAEILDELSTELMKYVKETINDKRNASANEITAMTEAAKILLLIAHVK
jgi:hypothetical protein